MSCLYLVLDFSLKYLNLHLSTQPITEKDFQFKYFYLKGSDYKHIVVCEYNFITQLHSLFAFHPFDTRLFRCDFYPLLIGSECNGTDTDTFINVVFIVLLLFPIGKLYSSFQIIFLQIYIYIIYKINVIKNKHIIDIDL